MACSDVCDVNTMRQNIFPLIPANCKSCLTLDHSMVLVYKAVVLLSWAAEFMAIFLLVYAAILYFTSAGDESKTSMAKKVIMAVIVGIVIILLARWFLYYITMVITPQGNRVNVIDLTNTYIAP